MCAKHVAMPTNWHSLLTSVAISSLYPLCAGTNSQNQNSGDHNLVSRTNLSVAPAQKTHLIKISADSVGNSDTIIS